MRDLETCTPTEEPNEITGTLVTGLQISVLVSGFMAIGHHAGWALGFGAGAAISLFSTFSLGVLVPVLSRPGAPRASQFVLAMLLLLKLPVYVLALYLVTRVCGDDAKFAFLGIMVSPAVIGGRTIGKLIFQSTVDTVRRRQIRRGGRRVKSVTSGHLRATRVVPVDPVHKQG